MTISTLKLPNHQVILKNISWKTYEALLTDIGEKSRIQLTYDQGILEIMVPLDPHETYAEILGRIVTTITEELNLEIRSLGSRTCKREDLNQGLEPDKCFYIQNEAIVRDLDPIDLNQYPPPDLVIEIDITSHSINRLELYARLGVPEVWQYNEKQFTIHE